MLKTQYVGARGDLNARQIDSTRKEAAAGEFDLLGRIWASFAKSFCQFGLFTNLSKSIALLGAFKTNRIKSLRRFPHVYPIYEYLNTLIASPPKSYLLTYFQSSM